MSGSSLNPGTHEMDSSVLSRQPPLQRLEPQGFKAKMSPALNSNPATKISSFAKIKTQISELLSYFDVNKKHGPSCRGQAVARWRCRGTDRHRWWMARRAWLVAAPALHRHHSHPKTPVPSKGSAMEQHKGQDAKARVGLRQQEGWFVLHWPSQRMPAWHQWGS